MLVLDMWKRLNYGPITRMDDKINLEDAIKSVFKGKKSELYYYVDGYAEKQTERKGKVTCDNVPMDYIGEEKSKAKAEAMKSTSVVSKRLPVTLVTRKKYTKSHTEIYHPSRDVTNHERFLSDSEVKLSIYSEPALTK